MNLSTIVAMVAARLNGKVPIPKSDAAVKSAKKSLAISPDVWFRHGGKNWRGKKSNRRQWTKKKAHIRRRNAA